MADSPEEKTEELSEQPAAAPAQKSKKKPSKQIKYMGTADEVIMAKGDTFSGRLPEGLPRDLVWNWKNNHTISTNGLPSAAVDLILADDRFLDVTTMSPIPPSEGEKLWRSVKDAPEGQG